MPVSDSTEESDASEKTQDLLDATLVGRSGAMRRLKLLIPRVAASRSNVLIEGESGTGKELVARAVHLLSPRARAPFVAENCAALPDGVVESELFGHVRGAFTGAERDRVGLIALADGGTLFLDEVGDLGPRTQAKLLRVIQEGEYRPVGGKEMRRSDFRVIAATHRELGSMVEKGEFREDLYYRLNVIRVRVPPLRERVEDIPPLIEHTIRRLGAGRSGMGADGGAPRRDRAASLPSGACGAARANRSEEATGAPARPDACVEGAPRLPAETPSDAVLRLPLGVSKEALEMLLRYPWPGNVRELQNVVEAGMVLAVDGVIGVAELPERVIDHALSEPERRYQGGTKPHERVMIEIALNRFGGDKAKAARFIGWSRQKLYRLMARHGVRPTFGKE